jgi:hypothetical protein
MHIAYFDDSRDERGSALAIIGTVVIPDEKFHFLETAVGLTVEQFIPEEKWEEFEEFHAADLYGGHGVFENIDEGLRKQAIRDLLNLVGAMHLPFIYSAVNRRELELSAFGSSDPVDLAFRMCAKAIENIYATLVKRKAFVCLSSTIQRTLN